MTDRQTDKRTELQTVRVNSKIIIFPDRQRQTFLDRHENR